MSTGLLNFLDIDKPDVNWIDDIINYLKLRFIGYDIEDDHIKFKIFILNFDIWFEDGYYFSHMRRIYVKNKSEIIDFLLFGLMKYKKGSVTIKHKSKKDILYHIKNMSKIIKAMKNSDILKGE